MKKTFFILMQLFYCMAMLAQWTDNSLLNTKVTPEGQKVYGDEFVVNKDGVVFYNFNGPSGGTTATFLQILDKNGNKTLPEPGLMIADERARTWVAVNQMMMADRDGNVILAVSDCRYADRGSNLLSYTLYKVSPKGEMLWGTDGISLEKGRTNAEEAKMSMIQLEDGSYVLAWQTLSEKNSNNTIYIERLSSDGEFLLENPIVLADEKMSFMYPWLVNAGDNQFIMVYSKGSNQELTAQKFDFDGSAIWPREVVIYRGGFGDIPIWTFVEVISDKKGGVFVGWYDDRYFTNFSKTYVSHVTTDGQLGFVSGMDGTALSNPEYLMGLGPKMVYDSKTNSLFTVHRECDGNQNWHKLVLQKVSMDGELMWGPTGIDLTDLKNESSVGYYSMQATGDGDVVIFYMCLNGVASNGNVDVYAVRIDGESQDAYRVWGDKPVSLSTYASHKADLRSSALINDCYYLTLWDDNRVVEKDKVVEEKFMQVINLDGSLSNVMSGMTDKKMDDSVKFAVLAAEDWMTFFIDQEQEGQVTIEVYSTEGVKLVVPFCSFLGSGPQKIIWNSDLLESGVYIVTLRTEQCVKSISVVL